MKRVSLAIAIFLGIVVVASIVLVAVGYLAGRDMLPVVKWLGTGLALVLALVFWLESQQEPQRQKEIERLFEKYLNTGKPEVLKKIHKLRPTRQDVLVVRQLCSYSLFDSRASRADKFYRAIREAARETV